MSRKPGSSSSPQVVVGRPTAPDGSGASVARTATPARTAPPSGGSVVVVSSDVSRPANVTIEAGKSNVVTIRAGNASTPAAPVPIAARPPASSEGAHAPVRIGGYEVAARIARGGLGSLYVCRRSGPGQQRLLTMKVVRQHTIAHELAAASFRHEAVIGSLFRHPNAQTVVDAGVHEGQPYLVFDYVEGGTLADLLVEETRPGPAIIVSIVLDVLAALQAMHQATDAGGNPVGLVHCDVSPDNVLVGVDGVARLADFGSARFTAFKNESQPFAVSKPPYMPPEQFRGDKLDSRSDIYSTGVMLYTALTGQQPFAAESYDATVMNVMRKKLKPPSAFGAPKVLDDVCMQALSRGIDGRFVLAGAMAAALRSAAESQNLVESREAVGAWVRRAMGDEMARRHRLVESVFSAGRSQPLASTALVPAATAPGRPAEPGDRPHQTPRPEPVGAPGVERAARARRRRLTERQQTIIALSSAFAFAATVTIGLALSRHPAGRAHQASTGPLAGRLADGSR